MRDLLFMSGEFEVTMKPVFLRDRWMHTMTSKELILDPEGRVRRTGIQEDLHGVVYYNRAEDFSLEVKNLDFLIRYDVPCWPDPILLRKMSDRHETLRKCVEAGLVNHQVQFVEYGDKIEIPFPCVLKTGQAHRGEDKYLLIDETSLPKWEGTATVEPYFVGWSVRILTIGNRQWYVEYENPNSWVKNSQGASIVSVCELFDFDPMAEHARRVHDLFGLEVSGVDYVAEFDDTPHFLEINQFPGLNVRDDVTEHAQLFLSEQMEKIEAQAALGPHDTLKCDYGEQFPD